MRRVKLNLVFVVATVAAVGCSGRPGSPLSLCEDIQKKTNLVQTCEPPEVADDPPPGVRWARMHLKEDVYASVGMYDTDKAFDGSRTFDDCNSTECVSAIKSVFAGSSSDMTSFMGEVHSRKQRVRILFHGMRIGPFVAGHTPSEETRAAVQRVLDGYK